MISIIHALIYAVGVYDSNVGIHTLVVVGQPPMITLLIHAAVEY